MLTGKIKEISFSPEDDLLTLVIEEGIFVKSFHTVRIEGVSRALAGEEDAVRVGEDTPLNLMPFVGAYLSELLFNQTSADASCGAVEV